jgi:hypothetical protein
VLTIAFVPLELGTEPVAPWKWPLVLAIYFWLAIFWAWVLFTERRE